MDPVQFRLAYLKNDARMTEALRTATEKAGWMQRSSPAPASGGTIPGDEASLLTSEEAAFRRFVAEVEVDTSSGKVTVKRITMAYDCGLIINPDGVRNQIEGISCRE